MPHKILDTATGTGVGNTVKFSSIPTKWTVSVTHTGSPTTVITDIEGSLDGDTFYPLAEHTSVTADEAFHIVGKAFKYVRANLSVLTGGTSPTVTVKLLANEHD